MGGEIFRMSRTRDLEVLGGVNHIPGSRWPEMGLGAASWDQGSGGRGRKWVAM